MKAVLFAAIFALGLTPAFACDWNKEASNTSDEVVACSGSDCGATEQAAGESRTTQPTEPAMTAESATSAPVTLACTGSNC
jgi:hypothetical protein